MGDEVIPFEPIGEPTKTKPLPDSTPSIPLQKNKINLGHVTLGIFIGIIIAIAFVQLEISPQWVTDQTLDNQTNLAYQYGLYEGQQLTLIQILNTTIGCQETFNINVGNETHNIFLTECLNLNENQGG